VAEEIRHVIQIILAAHFGIFLKSCGIRGPEAADFAGWIGMALPSTIEDDYAWNFTAHVPSPSAADGRNRSGANDKLPVVTALPCVVTGTTVKVWVEGRPNNLTAPCFFLRQIL
jgi:hypothetical protein